MGLSLDGLTVYPVPGDSANSVWGCLLTSGTDIAKTDVGRNMFCQLISTTLYIPERSLLYPTLSAAETDQLFKGKKHVLHPEFGLVELEEPVDWKRLIALLVEIKPAIYEPAPIPFIPTLVRTLHIKPSSPEETLDALEKDFPEPKEFTDKPLSVFEKMKLSLYRTLFTKKTAHSETGQDPAAHAWLLSRLESIKNLFPERMGNWISQLQLKYEELERRNQKRVDRLMELLKEKPHEALQYAIPLDTDGVGRGSSNPSLLELQKRWTDFSLFNTARTRSGNGMAVLPDKAFRQLEAQYRQTAQELIKQKDYKKAAFVYMKLLRDYYMAAQVLEEGGFYQEAGTIYLKYCRNKIKAAECFERGNLISQAIEVYEELNQFEKAGDLHSLLLHTAEARNCYQKVADSYVQNHQYVKASQLYRNKMNNPETSQSLLLKGWRLNKDASNCLCSYFAGIPDTKQLSNELRHVYEKEVTTLNGETFLQVLKIQYDQHKELSPLIKEIAYEVIVSGAAVNPSVVSELKAFNKEDKELVKDTMRFRVNLKKR